MKLFFCDTETTGVDPQCHAVVQISGSIHIPSPSGWEKQETFDLTMRPFEGAVLEPSALEVNGHTKEKLLGYESPLARLAELRKIMGKYVNPYDRRDKFWFIGYNAPFDHGMVNSWFKRCGDTYCMSWFHFPPLDVAQLAAIALIQRRPDMRRFKLSDVAHELGIQIDEKRLHDALYDIELTEDVFWQVIPDELRQHGTAAGE